MDNIQSDHKPVSGQRKSEHGDTAVLGKLNRLLTSDFCPSWNRYVYWLKNPFWLLVLAIAGSTVCGALVNPLVFFLSLVLSVVAAAGVLLPWLSIRGIECEVHFDQRRARVGTATGVRLRIRNRLPLPVWGLSLVQGFFDPHAESAGGIALARIPGRSTMEFTWPFVPVRRGLYPQAEAAVETGFPFGLYTATRPAVVRGQLVVWPEAILLSGMPDAPGTERVQENTSPRKAGDYGDLTGTRGFRQGDSLRRVHWAQTARHRRLIVTERESPSITTVRVIPELGRQIHQSPHTSSEMLLDRTIRITAAICESLYRQHSRVELALGSELFAAENAAREFERMMDALALTGFIEDVPTSRSLHYEIVVTTDSVHAAAHPRRIVIGPKADLRDAWIPLGPDALRKDALKELWKEACHA